MNRSFQHDIPKARINITLDLNEGDVKKQVELPLNLLVLGNYSGKYSDAPIQQREKISLNKDNFNLVLKNLGPKLDFTVPNKLSSENSELAINLSFDSMKSFSPDEVVKQVPELSKLLAVRNLLKELKVDLSDNTKLRKELEKIIIETNRLKALQHELKEISIL